MTSGQWRGSDRRSRLPEGWPRLRNSILKRDGKRCTTMIPGFGRCPNPATDVDHVIPGDDHSRENLASLCGPCHRQKSAAEGVAARQKPPAKRAPERHPGVR